MHACTHTHTHTHTHTAVKVGQGSASTTQAAANAANAAPVETRGTQGQAAGEANQLKYLIAGTLPFNSLLIGSHLYSRASLKYFRSSLDLVCKRFSLP